MKVCIVQYAHTYQCKDTLVYFTVHCTPETWVIWQISPFTRENLVCVYCVQSGLGW